MVLNRDTFIFIFGLLAPIAPATFSKPLVAIAVSFLVMRILVSSNLMFAIKNKIIILLFLIPGLFQTLYYSSNDVISFFPLFILILGYPFSGINISIGKLKKWIFFTIIYITVTQYHTALGYEYAINLRETYYPLPNSPWSERSFAQSLLVEFRTFRAGGIFHNPNVLGLVLIIYFFLFDWIILQSEKNKNYGRLQFQSFIYIFTILNVLLSLYLTGSRTSILGFFVFLYVRWLYPSMQIKNIFRAKYIVFNLLAVTFLIYFGAKFLLSTFFNTRGSGSIKLQVLVDYFYNVEILSLLLGGIHSVHFDQELGYWLGAVGIIGLCGLAILFTIYLKRFPVLRPIIIALLFVSPGNSVLYGLLTGVIVVYVFAIICASDNQSFELKSSLKSGSGLKVEGMYKFVKLREPKT